MNGLSREEVKAFQIKILSWYKKNKRDLPWRRTRDPYRILVSEIMLQQTQVARVIPKYEAWLKAFPTVQDLAKAKTADVLRLWSGLGYNRRALYLQKAARVLCHAEYPSGHLRLDSASPWDSIASSASARPSRDGLQNDTKKMLEALKKLPGIGEYTAAAVACFAFGQQVAVIDTNVRKVILTQFYHCHCEESKTTKQSHKRDCRASLAMTDKQLQEIATVLLPAGKAYEWNQALMDYASAVLKKEKIPVAKQSKFKGSDRYYRGQIIKILIEKQQVRVSELVKFFEKEKLFVEKIIKGLEKDGMVRQEFGKIMIN